MAGLYSKLVIESMDHLARVSFRTLLLLYSSLHVGFCITGTDDHTWIDLKSQPLVEFLRYVFTIIKYNYCEIHSQIQV